MKDFHMIVATMKQVTLKVKCILFAVDVEKYLKEHQDKPFIYVNTPILWETVMEHYSNILI
mgnify:CR=1 FL=1